MASAAKSLIQTLRRYVKKPWEITGPLASPEYRAAVPKATEYRLSCPATVPAKAIVPTSLPETVYDIKYFSRDQRRNRPPIKRTVLKKADVEKMMKEKTFDPSDFPRPYLTAKVEEDENAIGGGYQLCCKTVDCYMMSGVRFFVRDRAVELKRVFGILLALLPALWKD
ncbi:hypothetical protein BUALT_Bualt04G0135600 [Buddleja alternifolia]|uniref:Uncharacterized protein n=1 Tax=Buddleja alternifolia TaxID=168488 RepID=A0AAV6XZH9_9LAMI|nr:hypothetical protein BUALT_Bualt04G0135600 [Buddleja alternifolia]